MITRTELHIPRSAWTINHDSKLILLGSCFADNMGEKLIYHGFNAKVNPFGTTFNPMSLSIIIDMISGRSTIDNTKFVLTQSGWRHYDFHSMFAFLDLEELRHGIESSIEKARLFITKADFLFITLGTAIAYKLNDTGDWVNNCHKLPSQLFSKNDVSVSVGSQSLLKSLEKLVELNPNLQIGFTLSPVRHIKDGLQENARSKARCLLMIDLIVNKLGSNVAYFPAYEWMMDDLRDYRYYGDDMIHPSKKALHFIWQRFSEHYMNTETLMTCQEINQIRTGLSHHPFNPDSEENQIFLDKLKERQKMINEKNPHIIW